MHSIKMNQSGRNLLYTSLDTLLFTIGGYFLAYSIPQLLSLIFSISVPSIPLLQPIFAGIILACAVSINLFIAFFRGPRPLKTSSVHNDPENDGEEKAHTSTIPPTIGALLALTGILPAIAVVLLDTPIVPEALIIAGIVAGATIAASLTIRFTKYIIDSVMNGCSTVIKNLPEFTLNFEPGAKYALPIGLLFSTFLTVGLAAAGSALTFLSASYLSIPLPDITTATAAMTAVAMIAFNLVATSFNYVTSEPNENEINTHGNAVTNIKDESCKTKVSLYPAVFTGLIGVAGLFFGASFFAGMPLPLCAELAGIGAGAVAAASVGFAGCKQIVSLVCDCGAWCKEKFFGNDDYTALPSHSTYMPATPRTPTTPHTPSPQHYQRQQQPQGRGDSETPVRALNYSSNSESESDSN